jgi:3-hydroxyacyl-CoA dehydrogenase/enoyl-CoA hydratase/3-hydroxybutyryl-CoA epimerase
MVNEAAQCLDEKIVRHAGDVDLAMIFGTGFPPFRGGLLRYADARGVNEIVGRLNYLKKNYGERFKPCRYLQQLSESGQTFYGTAQVLAKV